MIRKQPLFIAAALLFSSMSVVTAKLQAEETIHAIEQRLKADIAYLADDAREGRGVGTQGLRDAGDMIAARFAELGLKTDTFGDHPFQEFTIPDGFHAAVPTSPGDAPKNLLKIGGDTPTEFKLNTDWTPLTLGANKEFQGEVVFAGYGITNQELEYDDYAGLDVTGKVVIVIRKQPGQSKPDGKFGSPQNSRHSYFTTKASNAAEHGAAALILVNDKMTVGGDAGDRLFGVSDAGRSSRDDAIPAIHVLRDAIDPIVKQATGKSLDELEALIDATEKPASQVLSGVSASGKTEVTRNDAPVRNVVGILPGAGSLVDEYVVVGAHYDHVGMGGSGSLAPGTHEVHNGADDNASGTASLLEIARAMSQDTSPNRRSIIFIAFTAEERGLLGSRHYVQHPLIPIEKTVAMVNLDMVGRLVDNGAVTVYGTGTAAEFPTWFDEWGPLHQLKLEYHPEGYGPSDHQSFHEVGLPVIHFFTGLHDQYHRPSDDAHLVDYSGMANVVLLANNLTYRLVTRPEPLTRQRNTGRARISGRPRGILGVTLDASSEKCVVSSVEEGGGAKNAGIAVGDTIIQIGDKTVEKIEDLQQGLRGHRPDDEIIVKVKRGEETLELKVTLGS